MNVVLHTHDLPVAERFGFWREVSRRVVAPMDLRRRETGDFQASARLVDLGTVLVSRATCPAYEAVRTPQLIRQCDPELYQLSLNLRGRSGVSQGRQDTCLGRLDMMLFDTSRPFHGRVVPEETFAEGVLVAFPRALLPVPECQVRQLIATPLPGDEGIGALLAGLLTDLTRRTDDYTAADATRLSAVLLDLIAAMLHQRLGTPTPPRIGRDALLVQIHRHIDRNLGDPTLSPATIADAFHISTRYLQKLFQSQGLTVAGWIRQRRLHGARRELVDPLRSHLPIHAIAARWGFPSPSQFSRAFRAAHDLSPAAYRRQAESWQK